MGEKSMAVAMIISFIFAGLGIAYAGDVKKGLIIFGASVVCNLASLYVGIIASIVSLIIWAYGMYATYQEVKLVNGE